MSIKFPDFQVLVTRTDQVGRLQRDGDPNAVGRLAPQVSQEFVRRQQRVEHSPGDIKVRPRREGQRQQQQEGQQKPKKKGSTKRHIDIRA